MTETLRSFDPNVLADLRAEFPHVDELYVQKHFPRAVSLARGYNLARSRIDPDVSATIAEARRIKTKLMAVVS